MGFIDSHIAEHQQAMKTGAVNLSGLGTVGQNRTAGVGAPTDQTGQPNDPLNALKSLLNQGGQNLG